MEDVLRFLTWALVVSPALIVAYKLLTRRINARGLLAGDGAVIATSRVQMLAATIYVVMKYLELLGQPSTGPVWSIPEAPAELLAILGTSQAIHIGGQGMISLDWFAFMRKT